MADKSEIIDQIEALAVHCRPPVMEPTARASWLRDWCDDLVGFPIESIRLGIREYRHCGETKFPTAGKLLPLIRAKLPVEKGAAVEVWRPLSDDEYAALSIRDKIRHQLILAKLAADRAGPMWKNPQGGASMKRPTPGHITFEDMPSAYRRWKGVEAGHLAEAKRLREFLKQPGGSAEGIAAQVEREGSRDHIELERQRGEG